jgi:hypothetical protein
MTLGHVGPQASEVGGVGDRNPEWKWPQIPCQQLPSNRARATVESSAAPPLFYTYHFRIESHGTGVSFPIGVLAAT